MRVLVWSYVVVSVIGAVHAVRRGRTARFAGIRLPGSAAQHALTIGSPLSAPPLLLIALVVATHQERLGVVRILSTLCVVGILGEVDTWTTLRRPRCDLLGAACVVLLTTLPLALILAT